MTGPTLNIHELMTDDQLLRRWFSDRKSWRAWFTFLAALFGLGLDQEGLTLFRQCTGRNVPASTGYVEATLICGRRGGKSVVLALIAVYLAAFFDWRPYLTGGERGVIMVIAADRRQAGVIFSYLREMLSVPLLRAMVIRETADTIELDNGIVVEIGTANFKTIRGRTVVAGLLDELGFWPTDTSVSPDTEVVGALRPAMSTIPRAMMLKASSPYARRGELWNDFQKHFGKDDSGVLVWQAETRLMNPSVAPEIIQAAYDADPIAAAAEYGACFRTDVENYISREAVEACVSLGVRERPRVPGVRYSGFVDPSGGIGDSMTLGVCHSETDKESGRLIAVLDVIREVRAPFVPESAVTEFSMLLKSYGVREVRGDRGHVVRGCVQAT